MVPDILIDYIGMYANLALHTTHCNQYIPYSIPYSTIHIIPILSNIILSDTIISHMILYNTKLCTAMMFT